MIEFYDRFDNRIVPGDFVVYGRNLGRCATTAIGRLVEVQYKLGGTTSRCAGTARRPAKSSS